MDFPSPVGANNGKVGELAGVQQARTGQVSGRHSAWVDDSLLRPVSDFATS